MMLQPKDITVSYRCPHCGEFVQSIGGIFALSGNLIRLKCTCGNSNMEISRSSDGKIQFTVPCFICEKNHIYTVSKSALFSGNLSNLSCAYSGLDICFIGEPEQVDQAQLQASLELDEILEYNDIPDFFSRQDRDDKQIDVDYAALSAAITVIKELAEDGKIHCDCTDKKRVGKPDENDLLRTTGEYENNCNGDFTFTLDNGVFCLICLKCGKKYAPPVDNISSIGFDSFLHTDEIILK